MTTTASTRAVVTGSWALTTEVGEHLVEVVGMAPDAVSRLSDFR